MNHFQTLFALFFAISLMACAEKSSTQTDAAIESPDNASITAAVDESAGKDKEQVATDDVETTSDEAQPADETKEVDDDAAKPPARTEYKGRQIARTMHWLGGNWLLRATREEEEHTSKVLEELKLKPGMTVADVGCGNGYYTLKIGKAIEGKNDDGDEGKVIGVEIQEEYFGQLRQRAQQANVENIELIIGELHDPNLPEASCDMIILVDVYHEFSHPEHMLKNMRKALKPTGTLALLEFRMEDPRVPIKPLHKMSKDQIMKEVPPNGYKLVREFDGLPWQHLMFFARDDSPLEKIEPTPHDGGYAEALKRRERRETQEGEE